MNEHYITGTGAGASGYAVPMRDSPPKAAGVFDQLANGFQEDIHRFETISKRMNELLERLLNPAPSSVNDRTAVPEKIAPNTCESRFYECHQRLQHIASELENVATRLERAV